MGMGLVLGLGLVVRVRVGVGVRVGVRVAAHLDALLARLDAFLVVLLLEPALG